MPSESPVPIREEPPKSLSYIPFIRKLIPEEIRKYTGHALAILCSTGEVIESVFDHGTGFAGEELSLLLRQSKYSGQPWRVLDGPSEGGPVFLADLPPHEIITESSQTPQELHS